MSAYALPGLFPPLEDAYSSSYAKSTITSSLTAVDGSFTSLASGTSLPPQEETLGSSKPVHSIDSPRQEGSSASTQSSNSTASTCSTSGVPEQQHQQNRNRSTTTTNSKRVKMPLHSYAQLPPLKSLEDEMDDQVENEDASNKSSIMLGIAIKEAKIDPVRLVQFLTGTGSTAVAASSKTLRRRCSKERITSNCSNSPHSSPANRMSMVGFASRHDKSRPSAAAAAAAVSTTSTSPVTSPHNEAIEFELSISFHGRKYTAKRTMQCIVKLRDDLIREMNARKEWLTRQIPPLPNDQSSLFETSTNSNNTIAMENLHIPEIPPLHFSAGDNCYQHDNHCNHHCNHHSSMVGGIGFVGRGFTMLHAMVTSYVPVMDRWLKNVMAIVPQDSECLLNFLWEPTSSSMDDFGSILEPKKDSCITMGSIKEMDSEEDDEDDD